MAKNLPLRVGVLVLCSALAVLTTAVPAAAQTVRTLPGGNWSVLVDTTAGGSAGIVRGPAVPPVGVGSLHLHVTAATDRVLVGTDLGNLASRPWSALSAAFSTYIPTGSPTSFAPSLRLAGFQTVSPVPAAFTTLSFEPRQNGTVQPGQWQAWTLGPDAIVWQTNTADGFCGQAATCTFAEFVARYPNGAWGQAQFGIGTGVTGPADGYVDGVTVADGDTAQTTDFDPPVVGGPAPPGASPSSGPTLPMTGTRTQPIVVVGGLMFIAGLVVVVAARRRVRH